MNRSTRNAYENDPEIILNLFNFIFAFFIVFVGLGDLLSTFELQIVIHPFIHFLMITFFNLIHKKPSKRTNRFLNYYFISGLLQSLFKVLLPFSIIFFYLRCFFHGMKSLILLSIFLLDSNQSFLIIQAKLKEKVLIVSFYIMFFLAAVNQDQLYLVLPHGIQVSALLCLYLIVGSLCPLQESYVNTRTVESLKYQVIAELSFTSLLFSNYSSIFFTISSLASYYSEYLLLLTLAAEFNKPHTN